MTNNSLVSTFTSYITIVVGVAFLSVATVGIVSPVHAQTTVNSTAAR
jgi:uncharacterized membrane protein YbaN (DUF454 family)